MSQHNSWADRLATTSDGVRLYARDYGADQTGKLPVLCLSGLTRTSREFHVLAEHLSGTRRVICPDYRGRGQSGFAEDWKTYMLVHELADALVVLDDLGIDKVFVIGTSRGGFIAMLMAAMHRDRLAGVVFNDIGPVIEPDGLARIVQYVGRVPQFANWREAVMAL
ncbi:MAG: alpha/beta fold hydrolase, partial [Aestuariivirgaceae bacterium]